ncbi:MAG: MFS transporter, partial [Halocynthiibacter sp.]
MRWLKTRACPAPPMSSKDGALFCGVVNISQSCRAAVQITSAKHAIPIKTLGLFCRTLPSGGFQSEKSPIPMSNEQKERAMTSVDTSHQTRNVVILVMAQAFLGAQMPIIFTIGGLAGQSLASNACFATLPISLIVLGSMFAATPLSLFMQKFGRRAGFILGALFGTLGATVAAYGLYLSSFPVFLIGSFLTGGYMSAHGFYRFAAADTASDTFRPKAISYVMAGGLVSALIGPQLVKVT